VLAHYRMTGPGAAAVHRPPRTARGIRRLRALDAMIGSKAFVCGDQITIADYLGSGIVTAGELVEL
jgi:glutathione S-transferase